TSNYLLTEMRDKNLSFHEALLQAKHHGYAERNPALDVNGDDAAHKLAILTLLGFGVSVRLEDIHIEGITRISQADIQYADDLGYCIKLLAIAKREGRELEVRVHPTLLWTRCWSESSRKLGRLRYRGCGAQYHKQQQPAGAADAALQS
ncbi:MAG: hypothetical protein HYU33_01055, partial [Candidatus Omnitrophica bacterium]|nr:hypothetical protein [Candidatus Omnitrophota bacterium]